VNEERTNGIILRTRRLTESSLIIHWLTSDFGRIATAAKGALRPKSPFRGKLDLFHEAELSFVRSRASDLHTLREMSLRQTHAGLRRDLIALQQASYAVELIERTTETDAPTPELHALMNSFVAALAVHGSSDVAMLAFELKLLAIHGLDPDADSANAPGTVREIITGLLKADWDALRSIAPGQLRPVINHSGRLLAYHFDRVPTLRTHAFPATGG
jgi:DNA repair protein RecO (recombination protein O)